MSILKESLKIRWYLSLGVAPHSTEVTVNIKVIDKSMPVFDKQFYSVSVPEDLKIHSHLSLSIKAESPLSRKLIYSISSGNTLEQFAVDFNTGIFVNISWHSVDE